MKTTLNLNDTLLTEAKVNAALDEVMKGRTDASVAEFRTSFALPILRAQRVTEVKTQFPLPADWQAFTLQSMRREHQMYLDAQRDLLKQEDDKIMPKGNQNRQVTIKDLLPYLGHPTLKGSRHSDPAALPTEEAPTVLRLREAGAVFLGATTTPEFGWKGGGDSPLTGITRNPWDLTRTTGGSA